MTELQFWEIIQNNLSIPFDFENVSEIEWDPMGNIYIDIEDGTSYTITIQPSEFSGEFLEDNID